MMRLLGLMILACLVMGCASALPRTSIERADRPGINAPPVQKVRSVIPEARRCLMQELTGRERKPLAVTNGPNMTGKEKYTEDGVGSFMTKDLVGITISTLRHYGMRVIDQSDLTRIQTEWEIRLQQANLMEKSGTPLTKPWGRVRVQITEFAIDPGAQVDVNVFGFGAGARAYSGKLTIHAWITRTGDNETVADSALTKDVVGVEIGGGITKFFGPIFVSANATIGTHESFADVLPAMLEYAVYDLLTQVEGITACHGYTHGTFGEEKKVS